MRRAVLGFAWRLAAATALAYAVMWLFVTPFSRIPLPDAAIAPIAKTLNFPVDLVGRVLPIHSITDPRSSCCFCDGSIFRRQQYELAIPTYVALLYLPALALRLKRLSSRA